MSSNQLVRHRNTRRLAADARKDSQTTNNDAREQAEREAAEAGSDSDDEGEEGEEDKPESKLRVGLKAAGARC